MDRVEAYKLALADCRAHMEEPSEAFNPSLVVANKEPDLLPGAGRKSKADPRPEIELEDLSKYNPPGWQKHQLTGRQAKGKKPSGRPKGS